MNEIDPWQESYGTFWIMLYVAFVAICVVVAIVKGVT